MSVVGELLTRDGKIAPIVPRAWKLAAAERPLPPSFLLILSDDQSWVGTSLPMIPGRPDTASDHHRTPNLERLAAQGMRFTDGYSPAPYCCPTRRSLQIGQSPARHEYQRDRQGWPAVYRRQLNVPRLLKAADARYRTAHLGKWDHRYDGISPADQGFDVSDGVTRGHHSPRSPLQLVHGHLREQSRFYVIGCATHGYFSAGV
jgi:arylsulfatase A-like enzyme